MPIANIRFTPVATSFAALVLFAATSNAAIAIDRATCVAPACELVEAAHVAHGQRGALTITDVKGRAWTLPRFESKPAGEIAFPRDWNDEKAVTEAYERYLAALDQASAPSVRISTDGRYHLCVSGGAVTCVYVPAKSHRA